MDKRVYLSFIIVAILSSLLIIYRIAYACCSIPIIKSSRETTIQGLEVVFKNTGDSRELNWNFGDGSPVKIGREVRHAFNQVGEMQVSAIYNGQCESQLIVKITAPTIIEKPDTIVEIEQVVEKPKHEESDVIVPPQNPCKSPESLNIQEFVEICSNYWDSNRDLRRKSQNEYKDLVEKYFGRMGSKVYVKGVEELKNGATDFTTLSKMFDQYKIVEIQPGNFILDKKTCVKKYTELRITLEENKP